MLMQVIPRFPRRTRGMAYINKLKYCGSNFWSSNEKKEEDINLESKQTFQNFHFIKSTQSINLFQLWKSKGSSLQGVELVKYRNLHWKKITLIFIKPIPFKNVVLFYLSFDK